MMTRSSAKAHPRRRLDRTEAVFTTASGATLIATAPPGHRPPRLFRPSVRRSRRLSARP